VDNELIINPLIGASLPDMYAQQPKVVSLMAYQTKANYVIVAFPSYKSPHWAINHLWVSKLAGTLLKLRW